MRIVIVGAGVAGCIMARTLSQLPGADVFCLERVARDDHSESGTGLNIGPNAVQALQAHDPALADAVTNSSFPWRTWKISLTDGTKLFDLPITAVANNEGWRIRWSELYRVLRKEAPIVSYDCTITAAGRSAHDPAKTFIEWTQGGARKRLDDIDLLIAADGRYSQLRRIFSGEPAIRHVGVAISRLLVPDTSGGLIDDYEQWFNGPNRLLAFRVPPDHVYAACSFPIAPDLPIADHLKSPEALRAAYTPANGLLTKQTRWLIDTVCAHADDMHWARLQEHEALYADPASNVLYLGDAAHGMVPTLGQGATQAIEDASFAGSLIASAWAEGIRDPRKWLRSIATRADRMRFVMQFSLEATDTMLAGADPVAGTLHKTEPDFVAKLDRLYRDVPGNAAPPNDHGLSAGTLNA
ncbi:FAD-dependent oxidoreductase [Pseudorhodoplanes sinuspersici]|uniref:FAD-dependent oxidoreductase n=1 Tax=Pseudorhodoplanes sinuspersici TaxID=1235591 RepID=A0A1W6ZSX1_9HYPH|nr:FAD-dependent monooxygenase [Pseudorhodoplanes sinuspersici]ARQ00519.1 FAD-dependent oxidoreductase [Pseudorhodoplanes sinuspersici]RKE67291.1 salicylate hydroxylase [Pseudorhodoplanes sinuspersici]